MAKAFDYFRLTDDIKLHLLSLFDVRDLITFACTSKPIRNTLLESNLPGVVGLFRNLLLLEVGDDLPLAQVDITAMVSRTPLAIYLSVCMWLIGGSTAYVWTHLQDWRRAIKHWRAMIFNWVPVSVDSEYTLHISLSATFQRSEDGRMKLVVLFPVVDRERCGMEGAACPLSAPCHHGGAYGLSVWRHGARGALAQ